MTGLIESTLYLSVTAIVILLFKWIFKNKLSAKWHVLIWALLAVRLVLPSLPESSFSIFNAIDIPKSSQRTVTEAYEENEPSDKDVDRLIYGETQSVPPQTIEKVPVSAPENDAQTQPSHITPQIKPDNTSLPETETTKPETAPVSADEEQTKKTWGINADAVVKWIYRVGTVILFVYFVSVYIVCITRIRRNGKSANKETLLLVEECKKKTGVSRKVYAVEYGNNPMLMGLVKPTIVLPDGYTEDEKRNIIIHELCHLKGGDIYLIWLSMIVLCFNWFNPIMWICFFIFRRDIEVYCDERVLKYIDSKKNYASLLVKTALKKNSFIAGTTSLKNGEKEVERRVKYMAYFKKPGIVWTVIIVVIAVIIGVVCLTDPKREKIKDDESDSVNTYPNVAYDIEECKPLVNIRQNCFIAETVQLKGQEYKYIVYNVQSQMSDDELTPQYSYYNIFVFKGNELVEIIEADADTRVYGYDIANTVLEADVNFDGRTDILVGTPVLGVERYSIYLQTDNGIEYRDTLDKMNTIHVNTQAKLFTGVYDGKEYKSFRITDGKIEFLDFVDEAYTDKIRDNTIELHEYAGVEVYPYLNEFFPHLDGDVIEYTGEFLFYEAVDFDGEVKVEKIKNTNDGIIYCLNILNPGMELIDNQKINPDCSKIYLLVTKNEIFRYESYNGRDSIALIMSPDADEFVIPSDFTNDGTTCVYRYHNPNVETGFYETFIFERGVGLVEYKRGYGAARDHVGLKMKGYESENDTSYSVRLAQFTDIDDSVGKNVTIYYPILMYQPENALSKKINDTIKEAALSQYYEFLNQGLDFTDTVWPVYYTVEYAGENYISVIFNGYYYVQGTAHGFDVTWAVNVDLTTGEKIYLFDVFGEDFYKYISMENFSSSSELDLDETEQELLSNVFAGAFMEFENNTCNNFHFTKDKFHIIHNIQSSGFCFTADYESLKPCMKDHPIWQELGVKKGKVLENTVNFYLEEKSPNEYYCEVYSNSGQTLIHSDTFKERPKFTHLKGSLYELKGQGEIFFFTNYINTATGYVSETLFTEGFYLAGDVVAFVNRIETFTADGNTKTGYITEICLFDVNKNRLVTSIDAEFLSDSLRYDYSIEYVDDTHISVTYYTENGQKENKEIIKIPSITGALTEDDFKITYNGFTFDLDTTVEQVMEYFPTEEIENISYVSGSPTAKRICLSYPNAREPDINIICIQNHETGEQFIETIVILSENIETARGIKPKDNILFVGMNYGNGNSLYTSGINSGSETYYFENASVSFVSFTDNWDDDLLINHITFSYRPDSPESRSIDLYQKELAGENTEEQAEVTVPEPDPKPTPAPVEIKTETKISEPVVETVPEVIPEVIPETPPVLDENTALEVETNVEVETDSSMLFDDEPNAEIPPLLSEEPEINEETELSNELEVQTETGFW